MSTYRRFAFLALLLIAACAGAQVARVRASYTMETFTLLDVWRDDSRHWNLFACADRGGSDCRWLGTLWSGRTIQTGSTLGYRRYVIAPERRLANGACQPPFDGIVLHDSPGWRGVDEDGALVRGSPGWSVEYIGESRTEHCDGSSRLQRRERAEFHPPSFIPMTRAPSSSLDHRGSATGSLPPDPSALSLDFDPVLGAMMLRGRAPTQEESSRPDAWSTERPSSPAPTGTLGPITIDANGQTRHRGQMLPPRSSGHMSDAGLRYEIHGLADTLP